jgi:signal transduction histidine kinase
VATAGLAQGSEAYSAHPPSPSVLRAIAIAACAAAAGSVMLALTSDHLTEPGVHAALMNWVTLTFVFAGLVAWWRRPDSRFGPLMIVAGAATFFASLSAANVAGLYTIGITFDLVAAVLFLHVFLAFPTGRLEGRVERTLVAAAYFTAFGLQLVGMGLGGFGPDNLLEVVAEPDAAYSLLKVQLVALSAFFLAGVAFLAIRRRGGSRPLRRPLALLVDSFGLALVMLAFLYLSAVFGLVSGQVAFETLRRATLFAIGLAPLVFLAALLHARLARAAVGDLFIELRRSPAPGDLRDALARALDDPSLTLVYWLPEFESWADLDGEVVALGGAGDGRAVTLIDRDGTHVAAMTHDAAVNDEPQLLEAVAAAAAIALENAQLHAEARARVAELKASRERIVTAGDAERRRLERNLHDGAQQRLVAVALQLRLLQRRIRADPATAEQLVTVASAELAQSLDELRELARGIHPAVLEHGLAGALDALANRSAVATTVWYDAPGRLPEPVELAAYFVACEALTNVAKYAHATTARVRVWRNEAAAFIEVVDDGVGGADDALGSGLRGLADRVEALSGRLRVVSPAGAGTTVTAELPCAP